MNAPTGMDAPETITVAAVRVRQLAGHRVIVLPRTVAPDLVCPALVEVEHGGVRVSAWAHRTTGITTGAGKKITLRKGTIAITTGAWRELQLSGDAADGVTVHLPARRSMRVDPAKIADLPRTARMHVAAAAVEQLTIRRGRSRWALVTANDIAAPVRLAARDTVAPDAVRAAHTLRALLGVRPQESVSMSRPPERPARERVAGLRLRSRAKSPAVRYVLGGARVAIRTVDLAFEHALRAFFRAPTLLVVTTQAHAGDDDVDVARIHASAFAALGIAPGDSVFVEWCGLRTAVRALDDYLPHGTSEQTVSRSVQRVERVAAHVADDLPPHLVVRLPAVVRHRVGMPAVTVVEVRRRLRPLVQRHLNQLVIPVGGLVLSSVAIEALRGWPVAVGAVATALAALANLRVPRTPSGLWP